jgi:hypothetical protein
MTEWTPAVGQFVLVVYEGLITCPGKVIAVDTGTRTATVHPVGEIDPLPAVPFDNIRRHPLSTQRDTSEKN